MSFRRILGLAILILGIVLIIVGFTAAHRVNEQVSVELGGHFTQKTTWYLVGGIVLVVVGGAMSFMRRKG